MKQNNISSSSGRDTIGLSCKTLLSLCVEHKNYRLALIKKHGLKEYIAILKRPAFYEFMDCKVIKDISHKKALSLMLDIYNRYNSENTGTEFRYALEDREAGLIVGSFVVHVISNITVEIGWYIISEYSGRNLGATFCGLLIDYIFKNLQNVTNIRAEIQSANKASIHLANKVGFIEKSRYQGSYTTNIIYNLDRASWETQRLGKA